VNWNALLSSVFGGVAPVQQNWNGAQEAMRMQMEYSSRAAAQQAMRYAEEFRNFPKDATVIDIEAEEVKEPNGLLTP
jgi:hypothetical protein